jgi:hypothetical protein
MENVRAEIAEVLADMDHIRLQENPQIEAEYALLIGCWETGALSSDIDARKAKRRCSLAQQAANVGKDINVSAIEAQLDREFSAWQGQVEATCQRYNELLRRRNASTVMPEAESKEMSQLHRMIVKSLHPDINPGLSKGEYDLLISAQNAYGRGDLVVIRAIAALVGTTDRRVGHSPDACDAASAMEAETAMLKAVLENIRARIESLKTDFPYNMKLNLCDSAWVAAKVNELRERIEHNNEVQRKYDKMCSRIMEGARVL